MNPWEVSVRLIAAEVSHLGVAMLGVGCMMDGSVVHLVGRRKWRRSGKRALYVGFMLVVANILWWTLGGVE